MKLIAVTACPSGVAHTYLAAEALEVAAKNNGVSMFVETQGSIGIENELTTEQIQDAKAVILTNNIGIKNEIRFKGKPIVRVSAGDCINKADQLIRTIIDKLETKV